MENIRILFADDEEEIQQLINKYLTRENYIVDIASDGKEVLKLFEKDKYNLIILDIMMPAIDGIELCRRLREKTNIPIIMLTAKDDDFDKVLGLSIGADDYITKPFIMKELIARIKAHLRRFYVLGGDKQQRTENDIIEYEGLTINTGSCQVFRDGTEIKLTAKEYKLLLFLMRSIGQVFTRQQLFKNVWEEDDFLEGDNTVMVHIRRLRKKIERDPDNPEYIQTVWGIGYRFGGSVDD